MALRVLLADDEKEFVETLAERLDLRGIEVRVALDGKAALTTLDEMAAAEALPDVMEQEGIRVREAVHIA